MINDKLLYRIGEVKNTWMEAAAYAQAIQFAAVMLLTYSSLVTPWLLKEFGIVLPYWVGIAIFVVAIALMYSFAKYIGIRANYLFVNRKLGEHGNFTAADMNKILDNQKLIMEKLGIENIKVSMRKPLIINYDKAQAPIKRKR